MVDTYPPISLPGEGGILKFVQLDIRGKPYLRFNISNHNKILSNTLEGFELGFDTMVETELEVYPELKGEHYEVFGMGHLAQEKNILKIWGKSEFYKIGVDENHLEKLKPYLPEGIKFEIFEIED